MLGLSNPICVISLLNLVDHGTCLWYCGVNGPRLHSLFILFVSLCSVDAGKDSLAWSFYHRLTQSSVKVLIDQSLQSTRVTGASRMNPDQPERVGYTWPTYRGVFKHMGGVGGSPWPPHILGDPIKWRCLNKKDTRLLTFLDKSIRQENVLIIKNNKEPYCFVLINVRFRCQNSTS